MFGLAILSMLLLALAGLLMVDMELVVAAQQKLQSDTDSLCLAIALELNKGDKVGKINNLVCDNRQLVDISRQITAASQEENLPLTALAYQLYYEDKCAAQMINKERMQIAKLTAKKVQKIVESYDKSNDYLSSRQLNNFQIEECSLGASGGNLSNVKIQPTNEFLLKSDLAAGFFDPNSKLYKANINLKISDQPEGVSFIASPIRLAPENETNPASLGNNDIVENAQAILQNYQATCVTFAFQPTSVNVNAATAIRLPFMATDLRLRAQSCAVSNSTSPWICDGEDQ